MNTPKQMHTRCHEDEAIIQAAADHAVKKTFAILGVDIADPESVEEFRQDLRFGKRMRKMADHGQLVMVGLVFAGFAWALWEGIKSFVKGLHA